MLLILIECAAEETSRSFRCDSGQIRQWVVWAVILVISESVLLQSQVLIDSKVMFLKFWMIFAKSLSLVYDEFFHKRNKFLLASPKEWISKILIRTPKRIFLIICFWHQTVYFQSSRREFSLSFGSLAIECTFVFSYLPVTSLHVYLHKATAKSIQFRQFQVRRDAKRKKVAKVLGKHKKLIRCDHEKNSARSKKEAEKFSLSLLAARKLFLFFNPRSLPFQLIENIIPPTEPKFSWIFSQFRFYYQNAMHYEFRFSLLRKLLPLSALICYLFFIL